MTTFKIQQIRTVGSVDTRKSMLKTVQLYVDITAVDVLEYDPQVVCGVIVDFFRVEGFSIEITKKALEIISANINNDVYSDGLSQVLKDNLHKTEHIYCLICKLAQLSNLNQLFSKLPSKLTESIISLVLQLFFTVNNSFQYNIRKQLATLLTLIDLKKALGGLKQSYFNSGKPFAILIAKCMQIVTKDKQIRAFIEKIVEYALTSDEEQIGMLLKDQAKNQSIIDYLFMNFPALAPIFIKQIKKTLNENNVLSVEQSISKQQSLIRTAAKEWINEQNNFWQIVDNYYFSTDSSKRNQLLALGQSLTSENKLSNSIIVKQLYQYMSNQYIDFAVEEKFARGKMDSFIEVYKAISHCVSMGFMSIIIIGVNNAPKWWPKCNPFHCESMPKNVKKFIEYHRDFYDKIHSNYSNERKKLQLVFNSFLVRDKETQEETFLSFEQLTDIVESKKGGLTFKTQYQPCAPKDIVIETRKDHPTIMQAKIVKFLKRNKKTVPISLLQQSISSDLATIEACLKRLIVKGMVEQSEEEKGYIYVP